MRSFLENGENYGPVSICMNLCVATELAGDDHEALVKYENEILGCTHAEVGANQLSMWGFDPRITEAVLNHAHGLDADVYTIGNAVCDANRSLAESLEKVR